MKLAHMLAAACAAALIAACQPPAPSAEPAPEAPAAEAGAETQSADAAAPAPTLPCNITGQRNWSAALSSGSPATLTVSGEIDLGAPGYGVSLARADGGDANVAVLALSLRAPTAPGPQVVTPHPVRYFAPANGAPASVRVSCEGATLTEIPVTAG